MQSVSFGVGKKEKRTAKKSEPLLDPSIAQRAMEGFSHYREGGTVCYMNDGKETLSLSLRVGGKVLMQLGYR